jgi:copper chaperone CopZ
MSIANAGGIMKEIKVRGMTCNHCVMRVTKALNEIGGMRDVNVDLESGIVSFTEEEDIDIKTIIAKIEEVGYEVE